MALQAQQIVSQATQIARVPGYTSQAGQLLNMILTELAQTYDIEAARKQAIVNLVPFSGSGPYVLPADYLRMAINNASYSVSGVPYVMINLELWEFDSLVQQPGISDFPQNFATDTSQDARTRFGGAVMFVWPPPSSTFQTNIRYYSQPPDIVTPETSTTVPWFPNQTYLVTRLAGELMKIAGDARQGQFLGNTPDGAQGLLDRFLKLQKDDEGRAKTVNLDRRRFGSSFNRLPNTKTIGW